MVTAVNKVKPLWTRVVTPIFKFGAVESILPFKSYCETSLIRLFSITPCLESKEKFLDKRRNDDIIEAATQDPKGNIILCINDSKRISVKYSEAKNIANKRGLQLLRVKITRTSDMYKMVTDGELKALGKHKVKEHVLNSYSSDHDFNTALKKVANNVKKHGEVILFIKARPRETLDEPPEFFLGKIKNYVTENSLPFNVATIKSSSQMLSFSIRNSDFKVQGTGNEGKTMKTNTELEP